MASSTQTPVVVMGTAFNLVHLLDALDASGTRVSLPAGSRLMETGGYKGRSRELSRPELHASASTILGLPADAVITEYGMTELSSQAYDRRPGSETTHAAPLERLLRFPHWARARIVSPETGSEVAEGETGIVEVTDLANVWSVAKVRTSDLAVRRGDGFQLVGRARAAEPRGCSRMTA